ncbi:hypothetical protein IWX49DRAFT_57633 [Phyllosticta citricarpa]|uniref:Uncharacterized protein n=2 Tax=Phyllosticta TaxID=121621 RepID=A0ABR1LDC4_9PEZI
MVEALASNIEVEPSTSTRRDLARRDLVIPSADDDLLPLYLSTQRTYFHSTTHLTIPHSHSTWRFNEPTSTHTTHLPIPHVPEHLSISTPVTMSDRKSHTTKAQAAIAPERPKTESFLDAAIREANEAIARLKAEKPTPVTGDSLAWIGNTLSNVETELEDLRKKNTEHYRVVLELRQKDQQHLKALGELRENHFKIVDQLSEAIVAVAKAAGAIPVDAETEGMPLEDIAQATLKESNAILELRQRDQNWLDIFRKLRADHFKIVDGFSDVILTMAKEAGAIPADAEKEGLRLEDVAQATCENIKFIRRKLETSTLRS